MSEVNRMKMERDWKSPALNIEEAALMPAISRHADGGAALKAALRSAEQIAGRKTVPVSGAGGGEAQKSAAPASKRFPRAALHQVMKRS